MLDKYGYDYAMFVNEEFNKEHLENYSFLNIKPVLPVARGLKEDIIIDEFVDRLTNSYFEHLKDYDIVLTHDIMFQGWFPSHDRVRSRMYPM